MARLPVVKPREAGRVLLRAGFVFVRQRGSHRMYVKGEIGVTIPWHDRDLKSGTLRHIIKQSGLTVEEFTALL